MEKRNRHSVRRNAARNLADIPYPIQKTCSKCKITKNASEFPKARREKDGLKSYCKECGSKQRRDWYLRNRELEIQKTVAWGIANPEKKKRYAKRTYAKHRSSRIARNKAIYEKNKDTILAANRQRYKTDAKYRNKKLRQCTESYNKRREKIKTYRKKYRAANRDRFKQWSNNARCRKAQSPGHCSHEEWLEILEYFNHHCAYCLKHQTLVGKLAMDHMTPLTRAGSNDPENIVPACKTCNSSKNNRTVLEFLGGFRLPRESRRQLIY